MNKLIPIAVIVFLFISCEKENDCCTNVPLIDPLSNNESLLVGRNWMLVAGSATVDGKVNNWYKEWDDCMKDNLLDLKSDGSAVVTEGLIYCNPDDPETVATGTWSLSSLEDEIILDFIAFNIDVLNHSILKFSLVIDNSGNSIINSYTYMAQ